MNITGKVIVITGATRGIGEALATRFAAEKPRGIAVSDIDQEGAELVVERLRDSGVAALAVPADVASKGEAENVVVTTEREFGPVDVLCSNAGTATGMGVHAPASIWERAWSVNVLGHVHLAQAALPSMSRRRSGHIVITASAAGLVGIPGDAPYAVSKSAAVALAEWLAVAYRHVGIRVSALCPLGVRTDLLGVRGDFLRLPWLPQQALMSRVSAVVCHAGHNTVCEALAHAVPLVLAPIRDDQPMVAEQVALSGAGLRLRFTHARTEHIGRALGRVLTEPSFATAAARIRDSFAAAGGAPAAADALERLA
jgi:NAD(P)-dependent dehydrogenase (short-subunit alcohol dehydrogenase family)